MFSVDIKTKAPQEECDRLFEVILNRLKAHFDQDTEEQFVANIDTYCVEIAKDLGLLYSRQADADKEPELVFRDPELSKGLN